MLRTMKAEIIVDLSQVQVENLSREDPHWMINGERGIVRLVGGSSLV